MAHLAPDMNPYHYTHNNPISRIDISGLTDIEITIQRFHETQNSTLGILSVSNSSNNNTLNGYTLELPDRNNQRHVSRINADSYNAELDQSDTHGNVVRLEDKNNRDNILIHPGNSPENTEGCILPGTNYSTDWVDDSRTMRNNIVNYINNIIEQDNQNNEETNITVIVTNPQIQRRDEQPTDQSGGLVDAW